MIQLKSIQERGRVGGTGISEETGRNRKCSTTTDVSHLACPDAYPTGPLCAIGLPAAGRQCTVLRQSETRTVWTSRLDLSHSCLGALRRLHRALQSSGCILRSAAIIVRRLHIHLKFVLAVGYGAGFGACDYDSDKAPRGTAGWEFAADALPEGDDGAPVMCPGSECAGIIMR
ncbi:unnamed protein product [Mycena citricolor]|uniref:Uncharacterized protein n=1 Tax=Mycena citricolor TaxID=2018698 RepID=A0AAD2H5U0_9AGAR|nr:unnamed protein product [Mycena citricolor]